MKVLLIGLNNHGYQLEGFDSEWDKFKSYLMYLCEKENPTLIAEELNDEAIDRWKANDSVARRVAKCLRVKHLFCDPDSNQRSRLGIKSQKEINHELGNGHSFLTTSNQLKKADNIEKSYWGIRENYWLEKLTEHDFEKCVFLVGVDHISSFSALLDENKIQFQIVEQDWKP